MHVQRVEVAVADVRHADHVAVLLCEERAHLGSGRRRRCEVAREPPLERVAHVRTPCSTRASARAPSPPHLRAKRRARSRELLAVAHLGRAHAPALLRLARAVGRPAGALVERPRARVVLEHPERRDRVLRAQLLLRALDQRAARAGRPRLRLDVDRVQLAEAPLVAARPDRDEADDLALAPRRRTSTSPAAAARAGRASAAAWMNRPASSSSAGKTCAYATCQPRSCTRAIASASPVVAALTCTGRRVRCRRRGARARPRRRRRPDGRRHRAGRRRVRPPRVAARPVPGRGRAGARGDGEEPDEARRRRSGDARAHRAGRRPRRRRPDDRGDRRGRRGEGGPLPPRRRDAARRRDPRVEHELDPDHVARRRHAAPGAGDRHALLQPGAGAEARRGDPRRPDLRRDGRRDRAARARPRQGAGRGARLSRASSRTGS